LWDSEEITVKGLWGSEEKTISLGSLTVNALCRTHNSVLSELDAGIRKISDTISELHRLATVRASIGKGKLSNIPKLKVDGNILERWAAKFLVGLFCAVGKKSYWHETKSGPLVPPESIVKSIYGLEPFVEPVGLYLAYAVGDSHYHEMWRSSNRNTHASRWRISWGEPGLKWIPLPYMVDPGNTARLIYSVLCGNLVWSRRGRADVSPKGGSV
jgi:hypothetical protein